MIIAIDFDGTCVEHDFPRVGKSINAEYPLQRVVESDNKLILYTMRSGRTLDDAIKWFEDNKIPLYGIQTNPTQKNWTSSPKCYAELYIDDAALGCPLITPKEGRPYVDWDIVTLMLISKGIINGNGNSTTLLF